MTFLVILIIAGTVVAVTAVSQHLSRQHDASLFVTRGTASAGFVSTYISEEANREKVAAEEYLSASQVDGNQFDTVSGSFGSMSTVLLDSGGRTLEVVPSDPFLIGQVIAPKDAHLSKAETGQVAVSNVVPPTVKGTTVVAIAVPFSTPSGRRVFSAAYQVSSTPLVAFVTHVVTFKVHQEALVDSNGKLVAASPSTSTSQGLSPVLASAVSAHPSRATVGTDGGQTYVVAPVSGTPWYLAISVPNATLYTATSGLAGVVPWVIVVFVVLLGALTVLLQRRQVLANRALRKLAVSMRSAALTDSLTGLYNRRHLLEHLEKIAANASRAGLEYAVLMIDLDRFKEINDGLGHHAGDEVLGAMAECLRGSVRAGDVYGRWGGDEFIVVLPTVGTDSPRVVAERILELAAAAEVVVDGNNVRFDLSIGCARGDEEHFDEVLRRADRAMYQAKDSGRGVVVEAEAEPTTLSTEEAAPGR